MEKKKRKKDSKVDRAGNEDAKRGEAAKRDKDMKETTLRYESYISSSLISPCPPMLMG